MKTGNLYILITIVITWCLLACCSSNKPVVAKKEKVTPEALAQALSEADTLFKQREDLDKLRTSIKLLEAARDPDNRNYQVEWTYAKHSFFLGKFTTNEDESEEALEKGRDAGKLASRVDPEKPDGHFWYAANLGELAKRSPVTVGLKSVDDIKDAMNRVIAIQPD